MEYTREMGVSAPELGWVPSPTYVLRRAAVLGHLASCPPGRVLEMGCGPGALLHDLERRGFTGVGVELSEAARQLGERLTGGLVGFQLAERLPPETPPFDYLLSFEVLEHIANDRGTLADWIAHLKDGGRTLLSVPAGRRRWDVTDVLAGHHRRYDREDVLDLVAGAGLHLDWIETYGFPATWLIARVRRAVRQAEVRRRGCDVEKIEAGDLELTKRSGVDRSTETRLFPLYGSWAGRQLLEGAARMQRLFRHTGWGISYLVMARK